MTLLQLLLVVQATAEVAVKLVGQVSPPALRSCGDVRWSSHVVHGSWTYP